MGRRLYSRHGNGQFRRATLENTFGLSAPSCPSCHRLNPHGVNEPAPETCHACGAPMKAEAVPEGTVATCATCSQEITLLGGLWTDPDGCVVCLASPGAALTDHAPASGRAA